MKECESPHHVEGCSGRGETKDHFTSKAIARELGWSRKQINAPENKQYLSTLCHREKDNIVPHLITLLKFQKSGGMVKLGEHYKKIDKKPYK